MTSGERAESRRKVVVVPMETASGDGGTSPTGARWSATSMAVR